MSTLINILSHGKQQIARGRIRQDVVSEIVDYLILNDYRIFFDDSRIDTPLENLRQEMIEHLDTLIILVYDYDMV